MSCLEPAVPLCLLGAWSVKELGCRVRSGLHILHANFFCHAPTTQWGCSNCPHLMDEQSEAQRSEEAPVGHSKPGSGSEKPSPHLFPCLRKAIWG